MLLLTMDKHCPMSLILFIMSCAITWGAYQVEFKKSWFPVNHKDKWFNYMRSDIKGGVMTTKQNYFAKIMQLYKFSGLRELQHHGHQQVKQCAEFNY